MQIKQRIVLAYYLYEYGFIKSSLCSLALCLQKKNIVTYLCNMWVMRFEKI